MQTSLSFIGFPKNGIDDLKLVESLAIKGEEMLLIKEKIKKLIPMCKQAHEELKARI